MAKQAVRRGRHANRERRLEAIAELLAAGTRKAGQIDKEISRRFGVSAHSVKKDRAEVLRSMRADAQAIPGGISEARRQYIQTLDWLDGKVKDWLDDSAGEGLAAKVRAAEALLKVAAERAKINGVRPPEEGDDRRGPVSVHLHLGPGSDGD